MNFPLEVKCSEIPYKMKLISLESMLHQGLTNITELITEFEQLHVDTENYKNEFLIQKTKCESKKCTSSESLLRIIETKDSIIQSVASALTKLNETKNYKIINEIFKLLCGETTLMTPISSTEHLPQDSKITMENEDLTPKTELSTSIIQDVSFKDESVSEIESTPTGRTSPIISTRKFRSNATVNSTEIRDKKKCPNSWPAPDKKTIKLTYPSRSKSSDMQGGRPNLRLKQARFSLTKLRQANTVDLTCSPEFSGGSRSVKKDDKFEVQPVIKRESFENDDTILPSPTSGIIDFSAIHRNAMRNKMELINTLSKIEVKTEENIEQNEKAEDITYLPDIYDSINLLQHLPKRFSNSPKKQSPPHPKSHGVDVLKQFDTIASISRLQNINKLDEIVKENVVENKSKSLRKSPLVENINVTNVEIDSSMSLLRPNQGIKVAIDGSPKRKSTENVEQLYKEPTIRKRAEKRALPGWFCEECKPFYEHLYKGDPVMLAKKLAECSKHRGRNNPARPKTPPGIWNPRWDVPDDTEEFNRRNNAI